MSAASTVIPNETALQQAWRFRLWGTGSFVTSQGKSVRVLEAGKLNTGPGPDFKDARISVDGNVWGGCIEIHRHAADWHRHGHDNDPAYDNVILHVVGCDDSKVYRSDGSEILQTVMNIRPEFVPMFNSFLNSRHYVLPMCGESLSEVASIFKTDWLTALAFERMQRKADDVSTRLKTYGGDWLQAVFVTLARGLGFGINADNMERMARATPYRILLKHSDNLETVEAILFGQAGLLNMAHPADSYEATLVTEYKFYSVKYGLKPIDSPLWQTSVRNTANSPSRRIAFLAAIVSRYNIDIASCLSGDVSSVNRFLDIELSDYWTYAFGFGRRVATRMSALGKQSRELLIINVLAPIIYARGIETADTRLLDNAIGLWESLPSEQNGIIREFGRHGIEARDAFTSQALIQLHREYCERRRCPECRLGHRLLSSFISFG